MPSLIAWINELRSFSHLHPAITFPASNPSKILLAFFPNDSSCLSSSSVVIELRSKEKSLRHFFAKEILRLSGALPHKKKIGFGAVCRPLWECQNACLPRFPPPSTSEHSSVPIFRIVRWRPSLRESYACAGKRLCGTINPTICALRLSDAANPKEAPTQQTPRKSLPTPQQPEMRKADQPRRNQLWFANPSSNPPCHLVVEERNPGHNERQPLIHPTNPPAVLDRQPPHKTFFFLPQSTRRRWRPFL